MSSAIVTVCFGGIAKPATVSCVIYSYLRITIELQGGMSWIQKKFYMSAEYRNIKVAFKSF